MEGLSVGSEFGFPRVSIKKKFKWYFVFSHPKRKKMNFSTDLPKSNPAVSYIVASAMKCAKFFPVTPKEGPCFRMHAVILKNSSMFSGVIWIGEQGMLNGGKGYILCHIRQVNPSQTDQLFMNPKRLQADIDSGDSSSNPHAKEKERKVDSEVNEATPKAKEADLKVLRLKPISILINNGCEVCSGTSTGKDKNPVLPKVQVFCNAKKLMEKIGKYRKDKAGSYAELYVTLSEAIQ